MRSAPIGLDNNTMSYLRVIGMLKDGQPFAFSRWGDGEFDCMLRKTGAKANCDGHEYFDDLATQLKGVLMTAPTKNYYFAMQPLAIDRMGNDIVKLLDSLGVYRTWYNADIFHNASIHNQLDHLFSKFDETTLAVGPAHLKPLFPRLIEIPTKNCWLTYHETLDRVRDNMKNVQILALCAGMMSNVLIEDLWHDFINVTMLDCGSVFDPYVGVKSRRYHDTILERVAK